MVVTSGMTTGGSSSKSSKGRRHAPKFLREGRIRRAWPRNFKMVLPTLAINVTDAPSIVTMVSEKRSGELITQLQNNKIVQIF